MSPIVIGPDSNVQDGVIIHAIKGTEVVIGRSSSISHGAIVHGPAKIGNGCFLGFRAVVFGATIGDGAYIGAAAVVQNVELASNAFVPPGSAVLTQAHADSLRHTEMYERDFMDGVLRANVRLAKGYMAMEGEAT